MNIIEFYTAIIESTGASIVEVQYGKALIKMVTVDEEPFKVEGKVLVLPTTEFLKNPDWDNYIAFHPIAENVLRGESPVVYGLRTLMQQRMNDVFMDIFLLLASVAGKPEHHKLLTTQQKKFLKLVPDFDGKTISKIDKVIDRIDPDNARKCVALYVKRGGDSETGTFKRRAVLTSPIIHDAIANGPSKTIWGVKFKVKEHPQVLALLNYVYGTTEEHYYSFGSNANSAPTLDAVLKSYSSLMVHFNTLLLDIKAKGKLWDADMEHLITDLEYMEYVDKLDSYTGKIPPLKGNEGPSAMEPEEEEEVPPPAKKSLVRQAPTPPPAGNASSTPPSTPPPTTPGKRPLSSMYAPQNTPPPAYVAPPPMPQQQQPTAWGGASWGNATSQAPQPQHRTITPYGQPTGYGAPATSYGQPTGHRW